MQITLRYAGLSKSRVLSASREKNQPLVWSIASQMKSAGWRRVKRSWFSKG